MMSKEPKSHHGLERKDPRSSKTEFLERVLRVSIRLIEVRADFLVVPKPYEHPYYWEPFFLTCGTKV